MLAFSIPHSEIPPSLLRYGGVDRLHSGIESLGFNLQILHLLSKGVSINSQELGSSDLDMTDPDQRRT